ncbi:hypothetical protein ACFLQ2_04815 [archaeon]
MEKRHKAAKEFDALYSVNRVFTRAHEDMLSYANVLEKQGEDPRYRKLAKLKKSELLENFKSIQKLLGEVGSYGGLKEKVVDDFKKKSNYIKEGDHQRIRYVAENTWDGYQRWKALKTHWLLDNRNEMKKLLSERYDIPENVVVVPGGSCAFLERKDELDGAVESVTWGIDVADSKKKALLEDLHKAMDKHGKLIIVTPFLHTNALLHEGPRMPELYALAKTVEAGAYERNLMLLSAGVQPGVQVLFAPTKQSDGWREAEKRYMDILDRHTVSQTPFPLLPVIKHEEEHGENRQFFNDVNEVVAKKHGKNPGEHEWQTLLLSAFGESMALREEYKGSLKKNAYPHAGDFEHQLGTLLAKAYEETGISKDEVKGIIREAAAKGKLEHAASKIAEKVKGHDALYRSIRVMIGKEKPNLHKRFRKAFADIREEHRKSE